MNVLVIDDSAFMRSALRKMIESDPGLSVVGVAKNGEQGLEMIRDLRPDVITLDIEMPVLDGLSTLRRLRREMSSPPVVIVFSSMTRRGSHEALEALRCGAADVIAKPGGPIGPCLEQVRGELIAKIHALGRRATAAEPRRRRTPGQPALPRLTRLDPQRTSLLVIGGSTGGPPVIERILLTLTPGFACPIVIAQHMPPMFTKSLAERLDGLCEISVFEGEHGQRLQNGAAYVAPGGLQTRVTRSGRHELVLDVREGSASDLFRPSVDVLFLSAAQSVGSSCAAVVLTGMGNDGAIGAERLRARRAKIISQDQASCVVYGMPRAVEVRGLCDAVLDVEGIAALLGTLGRPARGSLSAA